MARTMGNALLLSGALVLSGCGSSAATSVKTRSAQTTTTTTTMASTTTTTRVATQNPLKNYYSSGAIYDEARWATTGDHNVWAISKSRTTWSLVWHHKAPIMAFAAPSPTDAWVLTVPSQSSDQIELWHTTDGGSTWTSTTTNAHTGSAVLLASISMTSSGQGHIMVNGVPATLQARTSIFSISHNQLQTTPVLDNKWTVLCEDISFATPLIGTAGNCGAYYHFSLYRTRNGGATWQPVGNGLDLVTGPIEFVTPTVGYASGEGSLLRTTDSGATWSNVPTPVPASNICNSTWLTSKQGWIWDCPQYGSSLWETSNGGQSWSRLIALNITNMAQFTSATNGWAIVSSGKPQTNPVKLVHTVDGGRTWTTVKVNYK